MKEIVKEKFKSLNCAQIIFDHFFKNKDFVAMASLFGGGFTQAGLCGSYAASLGVLGVYFTDKDVLQSKASEFKNEYEKLYKSTICSEILGADYRSKDGLKKIQDNDLFGTTCVDLTANCIEILERLLPASHTQK
ncbi:C-GCAxxG-C-C family protein [Campylobacter mucosalis]|uniref:C_GCAxxG_C_C family protein n=1 Tax=Campylobacter mucosalis CCUG 21559 TaxID=1032067 RepID=A0A6G5QEX2_9BACT|nr:C-GCAxxG-C-C family protein [Campylobacter mucosalis]KEA45870.1 hypothetical protein CR66_05575 [Campylobacter mucosalis]QCD44046.1 C_GCAxxG_C_C family protein [Campylobacter mucosalis CCUG 21559]QKF62404.1 C_GCAxxG_C_C family protein [Campylobacter mucosalis]